MCILIMARNVEDIVNVVNSFVTSQRVAELGRIQRVKLKLLHNIKDKKNNHLFFSSVKVCNFVKCQFRPITKCLIWIKANIGTYSMNK